MKRKNAESVGSVLQQFLRQEGLETPLLQHRAIQKFHELMGPGIAPYVGEMFIRNQILYIQIKSPALRDNLMMERERLVMRLNQTVGSQVITRVIFR